MSKKKENAEKLLKELSNVDEKFITEASPFEKKNVHILRYAALAACFVFAVTGAIFYFKSGMDKIDDTPEMAEEQDDLQISSNSHTETDYDLPLIDFSDKPKTIIPGGFGMGVVTKDESLVKPYKIINEIEIPATLPVFENKIHNTADGLIGVDEEKMDKVLLETIESLGFCKDDIEDTKQESSYPNQVWAKVGEYEVSVDHNSTKTISFDSPITIPKKFLGEGGVPNSFKKANELGEYLEKELVAGKFKNLFNFKNPSFAVSFDGDTRLGEEANSGFAPSYLVSFFDSGETTENRILNYNFSNASFDIYDGKIHCIYIFDFDKSLKLGDYPIITVDEAKEKIKQENPSLNDKELIYAGISYNTFSYYAIPEYKFIVKEETFENGFTAFNEYTTYAVPENYIKIK